MDRFIDTIKNTAIINNSSDDPAIFDPWYTGNTSPPLVVLNLLRMNFVNPTHNLI